MLRKHSKISVFQKSYHYFLPVSHQFQTGTCETDFWISHSSNSRTDTLFNFPLRDSTSMFPSLIYHTLKPYDVRSGVESSLDSSLYTFIVPLYVTKLKGFKETIRDPFYLFYGYAWETLWYLCFWRCVFWFSWNKSINGQVKLLPWKNFHLWW